MEYLKKMNEYVWILYNDRQIHQVMNGSEALRLIGGFVVDTSTKANGIQLRTDTLPYGYYGCIARVGDGYVFKKSTR